MLFICFCFLLVFKKISDCFALCVVFRLTVFVYKLTFIHCYFHVHVLQSSVICGCQQNTTGICSWSQFSRRFTVNVLVIAYDKQNGGRIGLFHLIMINYKVSTGYPAVMLTEGAIVDLSSTHQL